MRVKIELALLGGCIVFAPAVAQDKAAVPARPPEKKICRQITPTGSLISKRFCLTAADWAEFSQISSNSANKALSGRDVHGRLSVSGGTDD